MPEISSRITGMHDGGSDGWDVFYRARALAGSGVPVVELTIGEHDIRTDPAIIEAMGQAAREGATGYSVVPGIQALREALAARLTERTGVPTGPENVLVTAGGQAALFAAQMIACDPGDSALYVDPCYVTYSGTIRAVGATPVPVTATAEAGFRPDRGALDEAASEHDARSLLINTPNNPTGAVYGRRTLERVAEVARSHDLWLISDEVYDTQVWDGEHLSPRALPGMAEHTMVVGSMSKSHAMTGSRIGWLVAPEEVISRLVGLSTVTTYAVPGYIQQAALCALGEGGELEEEVAAPFRRRRDLALEVLSRQNIVRPLPPEGAMYIMLDIRATGLSGISFAEALLDVHRIAVMPGESFGSAAAGHVRVALTVPDEILVDALGTLCTFAEARAEAA